MIVFTEMRKILSGIKSMPLVSSYSFKDEPEMAVKWRSEMGNLSKPQGIGQHPKGGRSGYDGP